MKKARTAKERSKVFKIKARGKGKHHSMEVAGHVEEHISVGIAQKEKWMQLTEQSRVYRRSRK